MMQNKVQIFGITGATGSGKSYIAALFKTYDPNTSIINVDKIAHCILKNEAYEEIVQTFGKTILNNDNSIDRKKLGTIVFKNKKELHKLNSIVQSYITKNVYTIVSKKINSHISYTPCTIVIDAALLVELNLHLICDNIILVLSNKKLQIERIKERDNLTATLAQDRVNSQRNFNDILNIANIVIRNN